MESKMRINRTQSSARQHGAALVVGLILLLVLTILAISTMNTSTTEVIMAQNARFSANAFQAAETAIDTAMVSGLRPPQVTPFVQPPVPAPDGVSQLGFTLAYDECLEMAPGFSVGAGTGFADHHYNITSTGTSTRNATSTHVQSFKVVGPSC